MNVLNKEKQISIIGGLAECVSIRNLERMTGVHRDTIMCVWTVENLIEFAG